MVASINKPKRLSAGLGRADGDDECKIAFAGRSVVVGGWTGSWRAPFHFHYVEAVVVVVG
jgi:hypothetical protein